MKIYIGNKKITDKQRKKQKLENQQEKKGIKKVKKITRERK